MRHPRWHKNSRIITPSLNLLKIRTHTGRRQAIQYIMTRMSPMLNGYYFTKPRTAYFRIKIISVISSYSQWSVTHGTTQPQYSPHSSILQSMKNLSSTTSTHIGTGSTPKALALAAKALDTKPLANDTAVSTAESHGIQIPVSIHKSDASLLRSQPLLRNTPR